MYSSTLLLSLLYRMPKAIKSLGVLAH